MTEINVPPPYLEELCVCKERVGVQQQPVNYQT